MNVAGSLAVVTGASSGIGRATALALADAGADLVLVARRSALLDEVCAEVEHRGRRATPLVCDVGDMRAVEAAGHRVEREHGGADLLVCAAGIPLHRRLTEVSPAELEQVMRVNYLGTVAWICALLPGMRRKQCGFIVCVGSIAGAIPWAMEPGYSASKAAVIALCEAGAPDLARDGVGICWVNPGLVRTALFDDTALADIPAGMRRSWMPPERVAATIVAAIHRDRRGITLPRRLGLAAVLRHVAPRPFRSGVRRTFEAALRHNQKP